MKIASCTTNYVAPKAAPTTGAQAPSDPVDHGFDMSNLDNSVRPQDDFFNYAVGGWIKAHPIPDDKTRVGSFDQLAERNQQALHSILDGLQTQNAAPGSNDQKLRDFYASGMDLATIEAAGAKPLQPLFDQIESIQTKSDLMHQVAQLQNQGINPFFSFGASPDAKNSSQMIAEADQGGLGLPDRDYYTKTDAKSVEIRQAYQQHVANLFQLLGDSPETAAAEAQTVLNVETRLANASLTNVELRDADKTYHITSRQQLEEMTPNLDWGTYLKDRGQENLTSLNVGMPGFFQELDKMVGDTSLADLKTYLRFHTIASTAGALSKPFTDENFNFGKLLSGAKAPADRWKKIVAATDNALGEALGQKYIETNFSAESKARVKEMLGNIRAVLKDDLKSLSWMTQATRDQATAKLEAIEEKIGYPDKWTDYSSLEIKPGPYVNNVLSANAFAVKTNLDQIGKPVDASAWGMTPPTVNAYYNPLNNEIVFPAGILQAPFFNPNADDAVNYGGIGVVIGHEITHGFDDSGANFDADGNLRDWWTADDKVRFKERSQGIIDQANNFQVQDGLNLNGNLVVGESMADLGGVELAYGALQRSLNGKAPVKVDGFTADQRFFLGFAQAFEGKTRPESERTQVTTDPHPVNRFRVNNTLSNVPQFASAFDVKQGDPMARPAEQQVILWESPRQA